jgi:hypothetical protein
MKPLRVLVACECSGVVREAFRALGRFAWSCDLLPAEDGSPNHIQGDALEAVRNPPRLAGKWDLVCAHPPCTRLCLSGALRLYRGGKKANGRDPQKCAELVEGAAFFRSFFDSYSGPLCVENPTMHSHARTLIGEPEGVVRQSVQPYEFGDDASKKTILWLRGLPPLVKNPAQYVAPRISQGRPRWANQTDSGQNKLAPSPGRAQARAKTYAGLANAMASQWAAHLASLSL